MSNHKIKAVRVQIKMTKEQLFWNRVGWLRHAMITAEDFEFRILWYWKLQDLLRRIP
jgi:hypothetical protein